MRREENGGAFIEYRKEMRPAFAGENYVYWKKQMPINLPDRPRSPGRLVRKDAFHAIEACMQE
ncbi:MAG: hypothetical protein A2268_09115 [Candidatus Raymondbacteria bacterium RifOxyA12_full_50_37]|uniref:Uncharacterized protein n=1 Tax=Candidatus Raymondbacteria bacterium RIFOXYD12_FULL_49_13 TaxID=1817890 RepID=A0A1F7F0U6_UNCRA|nr:MAG: hypothetical protein A2268_09115 [Candidatus Raymondbacteria bacterium RifOxyA12_full_50_37]OGJ86873.1 MAG: hypothetical protein A2248_08140 [Candidatus Raymondbacteria bacterium RIFOXYA2_FULL_49_16]OGK00222.1 MAG: hypothetical protein A2519_07050 [Candidatus Raymondbacteria bacterium RIFOXYD12_FULL_49_13]